MDLGIGLPATLGNSSYLVHTEDIEERDSVLQASTFFAGP